MEVPMAQDGGSPEPQRHSIEQTKKEQHPSERIAGPRRGPHESMRRYHPDKRAGWDTRSSARRQRAIEEQLAAAKGAPERKAIEPASPERDARELLFKADEASRLAGSENPKDQQRAREFFGDIKEQVRKDPGGEAFGKAIDALDQDPKNADKDAIVKSLHEAGLPGPLVSAMLSAKGYEPEQIAEVQRRMDESDRAMRIRAQGGETGVPPAPTGNGEGSTPISPTPPEEATGEAVPLTPTPPQEGSTGQAATPEVAPSGIDEAMDVTDEVQDLSGGGKEERKKLLDKLKGLDDKKLLKVGGKTIGYTILLAALVYINAEATIGKRLPKQ